MLWNNVSKRILDYHINYLVQQCISWVLWNPVQNTHKGMSFTEHSTGLHTKLWARGSCFRSTISWLQMSLVIFKLQGDFIHSFLIRHLTVRTTLATVYKQYSGLPLSLLCIQNDLKNWTSFSPGMVQQFTRVSQAFLYFKSCQPLQHQMPQFKVLISYRAPFWIFTQCLWVNPPKITPHTLSFN